MIPLIPFLVIVALLLGIGMIIGFRLGVRSPERSNIEPHNAIRALTLACGDDSYKHPDACQELCSLRAAGYDIKYVGGTRAGFMRIEIINPKSRLS